MSDEPITTTEAAPVAVEATEAAETTETTAAAPEADGEAVAPESDGEAQAPEPSKLLAALLRKRAKLKAENSRLAQARTDFERAQAQAQEQVRAAEQMRQLVERARGGDLEAMQALGFDYNEWTLKRLRAGTPEEKINTLQQQLEAERKARIERERAAEEAQQQAAAQQAVAQFVSLVTGGQYPETALYEPQEIAAAGNALADEMAAARGGRYPTLTEIAGELERRIAAKHARVRGGKAPAPPEPARRKPSPTLSNRDAAEKSRTNRPLSDEETKRLFNDWVAQNLMPR